MTADWLLKKKVMKIISFFNEGSGFKREKEKPNVINPSNQR